MKHQSKYRGCLLGGAIGDALGYSVEFLTRKEILHRFGPEGITQYALTDGVALISDDTQMTLFTANGLLRETTRLRFYGGLADYTDAIGNCYRDWYKTQRSAGKIPHPTMHG